MTNAIRPRTKAERMAVLTGFAMAVEMVEKNGTKAARAELRLMYEIEDSLPVPDTEKHDED